MKVSSLGRAARSQAGIKVRQPLAEIIVNVPSRSEREALKKLEAQILEELNVKGLKVAAEVATGESGLQKHDLVVTTEGG